MCSLLLSKDGQPILVPLLDLPFLGKQIECKLEFLSLTPCDWSKRYLDPISQYLESIWDIYVTPQTLVLNCDVKLYYSGFMTI